MYLCLEGQASTIKQTRQRQTAKPPRWTTARIILGAIGGLFWAPCLDFGGTARTSLELCFGFGIGMMVV